MSNHNTSNIILNAVSYCDVSKTSRVLNLAELLDNLHILLPPELVCNSELCKVEEVLPRHINCESYTDGIIRDGKHPWLDIKTDWLNTKLGYHMYKLTLCNSETKDEFPLYFAYSIQEDHPKQNYVYMKRDENE